MIHYNAATRTFNLLLANSYYAFQIDAERRLLHLGWGLRPPAAPAGLGLTGERPYETYTAFASFEGQIHPDELLGFGDVAIYHVTLKANFDPGPERTPDGEPALPIRDLRLRYVSHAVVVDAQPGLAPAHGQPTARSEPRETLRVTLEDSGWPFLVHLHYRLTPEHDIIERWLTLENRGQTPVTLETCNFASLHLPNGVTELTYVTGAWAREFTTQRRQLTQGIFTLESRSVQTSHAANPFFLLNRPAQAWEDGGCVYFGALAYGGSWHIAFEQLPSWQQRVHAGYNPHDFVLTIAPLASHTTPALVSGVCPDGWGGASRRLHAFTRERVLPAADGHPTLRPVLYNSWESVFFDLSYEKQAALARKAAAIGVELFCVDDGWFGARRSDRAGLGDWVVSPEVFPDGLEPLVALVKQLGMQFGLWVEPEMVNPDSDLYRAHPDWVLHFPGRPRSEMRNQLVLDFGRPEVVATIGDVLDALIGRYQIDFIKWDMNRSVTEPGSVVGKAIWRQHIAGVCYIMDRLRRNHPHLAIQSCSGGGGRIDLGILGRADQVWVSDNIDPFDRLRIQEGFSLAYPARIMEAWVGDTYNHQSKRDLLLNMRFDVAMRGALGIGASLNKLSDGELAAYARQIAFYKRIRPIVQSGALYRLQRLEEYGASIIEYVLPDGSQAVYSLVVDHYDVGSLRPSPPLRGLNPAATYRATDRHAHEIHRSSGYELMTLGIPNLTRGHPGFSQTLHIEQI